MPKLSLAALLCSSLALAAPPVPAEPPPAERPSLVVVAVGLDDDAAAEQGRLEQFAEQAVQRSGRFSLVRLADALDPAATRVRASKVAEGEAALAQGQKAYDDLDTLKAAQRFSDAVKAFKQTDLTRHLGSLSRAWVMKIAAMIANQDTRAAANELEKLLAVDPQAQFSSTYFSPEVLRQAEEARKSAQSGKAQLVLRTKPSGARVFVDGKFRGVSPATVSGLAPGEHFVSVLAPGRALYQEPQSAGTHEMNLRDAEQAAAYRDAMALLRRDPRGPKRDAAAMLIGKAAGADQVLLVLSAKSAQRNSLETVFVRLETRDGHNTGYESAPLPPGDAMALAVDSALGPVLTRDELRKGGRVSHLGGSAAPGTSASSPHSPLLTRRNVAYGLVGLGVAMVGAGVVFGVQANSAHHNFRKTPQIDTGAADDYQRRGKRFALMADVFTVAGLLSGGAGAYWGFVRKEAPAPRSTRVEPVTALGLFSAAHRD